MICSSKLITSFWPIRVQDSVALRLGDGEEERGSGNICCGLHQPDVGCVLVLSFCSVRTSERRFSETGVIEAASCSRTMLVWTYALCWWKRFPEYTVLTSSLTCTCTVLSVGLEECCRSSTRHLGFALQTARTACRPARRPRSSYRTPWFLPPARLPVKAQCFYSFGLFWGLFCKKKQNSMGWIMHVRPSVSPTVILGCVPNARA